jgi:ABC-2 type transport system permease protein
MAVYERAYRGYEGGLTPERARFLVIARYEIRRVFASRIFTAFFALCFVWPVTAAVILYVSQNLDRLSAYVAPNLQGGLDAITLDVGGWHAHLFLRVQAGMLGFVLALLVGPALVSSDMRNNGLPLYLSRPVSRAEYVAGKLSVLVLLMSAISWIPALLLFALQGHLAGGDWLSENWRLAPAIVAGGLAWILTLSMITVAVSSVVRMRTLSRASLFGLVFVSLGMGNAIALQLGSDIGKLINIFALIERVWTALLDSGFQDGFPLAAALLMLAAINALCALVLFRRIRAYEVVR